ncbi:low affinity iron permease family protein, partial [Nostoc sp. NIES-2111]
GTTTVPVLHVCRTRNTQTRDTPPVHTKLAELTRASAAQNRYIGIEDLTEEELVDLRQRCETRAKGHRLTDAKRAADAAQHGVNMKAAKAAEKASG